MREVMLYAMKWPYQTGAAAGSVAMLTLRKVTVATLSLVPVLTFSACDMYSNSSLYSRLFGR